ncbi:YeeE/YedE family protein [Methanoplanus sp. FWC-SCC4]|uniref:YeeE/YedE family protein n=1 Tax=Methanochimaera problematica TaxID=2609417 RepID=A0AA97FB57_9EURY|nr:YeeE/YedE thiosulfate transporter family protein [Methanoplanus sp. FWC-SCC4]WOF16180.1 YeeE/YedE family protein [Methanoplanus sp. FWC-SCC4]
MLTTLHKNRSAQLAIGLLMGIVFGFLIQKAGVTNYDVIIRQLLLQDFTVVKLIATAVLVGMPGVYILKHYGYAKLHIARGSLGTAVVGGLIFGVGFAVLGLCPGTVAGAVGQGYMDALFGGFIGIMLGTGLFAMLYPKISGGVLKCKMIQYDTIPDMLGIKPSYIIVISLILGAGFLYLLEYLGL